MLVSLINYEKKIIDTGWGSGLKLWSDNEKPFGEQQQDINDIKEITSETFEITYVGHSTRNQLRSGHTIASKSPQGFAQWIAQKYGANNKENLSDFYLIACEAGLGQPSYASLFLAEMHRQGFINVKVHAMTPDHPYAAMVVQSSFDDPAKIRAWGYESLAHLKRDMDFHYRDHTFVSFEARAKEMMLQEEIESTRHYIYKNYIDYKTVLNKSQHTYVSSISQQYDAAQAELATYEKASGVHVAKQLGLPTPNYDKAKQTCATLKEKLGTLTSPEKKDDSPQEGLDNSSL